MYSIIVVCIFNLLVLGCSGYETMDDNNYLYRYLRQERQKQLQDAVSFTFTYFNNILSRVYLFILVYTMYLSVYIFLLDYLSLVCIVLCIKIK
jgi:hypothetical protein